MNKDIPKVLWIAIVSLGLMVIFKLLLASHNNAILVDAIISACLLYGLYEGRKWAYYGMLLYVAITFMGYLLAGNATLALQILAANGMVVIPMIICKDYYFTDNGISL